MSEQEDIEDFISRVVSETEDLSDLKRLALDINRVGSRFADKSEGYSKTLANIDRRLRKAEDDFDNMVQRLMVAPPGTVNTSSLNIRGGSQGSSFGIPSTGPVNTKASPAGPTPAGPTPNLKAGPAAAGPTPPAGGGPNLKAGPTATAAGPNLSAGPAPAGPNLSAGPNLTTAAAGPNLGAAGGSGGGPNLNAGPNLKAAAPGGAPGGLAGGIADALANLKKAPEKEESGGSSGGGGITAGGIKDALANLKKAPEKEEKSGGGGPLGGFNPAEALKSLKKAPRKDEEEEISKEPSKSEFASILEKRRQTTEDEIEGKASEPEKKEPTPAEPSAEDMKAQLQNRLKSAFKK
ncbi:MAG: hypothetical protein ACXAE3_01185 [Candidatus Kariarchaeaceae archaeon]